MNKTINVTIRDKIATAQKDALYICGNSDFIVNFDFDDEWLEHQIKTARFIYGGSYTDMVFEGNQCPVPVISDTYNIKVGVFAGDLKTSTPAHVSAKKSILCESGSGTPVAPTPDVYNQIMDRVNEVAKEAAQPVSWNDLQDKPFDGDYVEVVPEQMALVSDDGVSPELATVERLVVGTAYTVKFNEGEYECVAYHPMDADDMVNIDFVVLGDCTYADGVIPGLHGEDNNEPFAIIQQGNTITLYADMEGDHTIAVGIGHIVKLDNKYLDMDTVPTRNSKKPVTSGGVAKAIEGFASKDFVRQTIERAEQDDFSGSWYDLKDRPESIVTGDELAHAIEGLASEEFVKETIDEMEIPKQVQSDWNQNDSTAVDYIKNRPITSKGAVVVEEQTVATENEWGEGSCAELSTLGVLEAGKTYTVLFNGTAYECVAYHPTEEGSDSVLEDIVIGSVTYLDDLIPISLVDGGNGEPFAIIYTGMCAFVYVAKDGTYTVKVTASEVKLNPNYLDMDAIKAALPTMEMTATLEDGTTATYTLFGEVVTE